MRDSPTGSKGLKIAKIRHYVFLIAEEPGQSRKSLQ